LKKVKQTRVSLSPRLFTLVQEAQNAKPPPDPGPTN
jgi:hypothetical protein